MVRCDRPKCSGTIEDGFCADCGLAPAGASRISAVTALTSRSTVSSGSSITGGSSAGSRPRTTGSRRGGLGAGFVSLPPLPAQDPLTRVLAHASVPEKRRLCGGCQQRLRHESGFCSSCGAAYSFKPTLHAGDVVAAQYEVKGPIAYGGLGWIYLAQDQRLKNRWVVLKGLLDSKNAGAATVALQEREFLSAVKHPQVVSVYNFVSHGSEGFIVMEHVGGKTLAEIRKERGPLPPVEAIAYVHRVLGAFSYLHENGMVYCDFKPSNVMLEDDVKLIDLGGVRRVTDSEGEVYGTKGFFAPEIARGEAPTFVSDLYTIARTLLVLVVEVDLVERPFALPPEHEAPVLARHESLRRFLEKATRSDPARRFGSADEMATQLLGVLRDAAVIEGLPSHAVESALFHGDALDLEREPEAAARPSARVLPEVKLDELDPAAAALVSVGLAPGARGTGGLEKLEREFPGSGEVKLRLAVAQARAGDLDGARARLRALHARDAGDWRASWASGRIHLESGHSREAVQAFEHVLSEVPGELAAQLGLAVAYEQAGDVSLAARAYDRVSRSDPTFVTATFGLARCLMARGDSDGAVAAYASVPASSSAHLHAQVSLARTLLEPGSRKPSPQELARAALTIDPLPLPELARHELRSALFLKGIECLEAGAIPRASALVLLGIPAELGALRAAAERELRSCARYAPSRALQIELVDRANSVRPYTLV